MTAEDDPMEQRPEIKEIRAAEEWQKSIEEKYLKDLRLARSRRAAAGRALNAIANMPERLAVITYAYENTTANKNSLAWAYFEKENYCWHLRRVMRGSIRNCGTCGHDKPTSYWNFDKEPFLCEDCDNNQAATRQKLYNDRDRQAEVQRRQMAARIEELRSRSRLPPKELDELVELLNYF